MIKKIKEFYRSSSKRQKLILMIVIGLLNYFLYLVIQLFSLINFDWLIQCFELFWWLVEIIFVELYIIVPFSIFLVHKLLPKKKIS